jgi:AcrR family transcriptional regulator
MDTDARLIEALWSTVAARGWRGLTATRLAEVSGVPAGELVARFPSRLDLLRLHTEAMDAEVMAGTVPGQGGSPRDRLFDVMMRRIDALQNHRPGLLRFMGEARTDPLLGLALAPVLRASMARMLEAAELDAAGPAGSARAVGLVGVWLMTLRAWEGDGTVDLGPTMAALDRALDRAEATARSLGIGPGDLAPPAEGDGPTPP